MAIKEDNEDLVRVGPGTVMGEFMREYWLPAAKSSEVVPDGPPLRLALLGEKLIAFRDSSGRVGVMDHRCPHRSVSLFLGRNEHDGLRCVYHGWKFDVQGNCVDMPGIAVADRIKSKMKARAYPAAERAGVIWVYMGKREVPPPLPLLEVTTLPQEDLVVFFIQRHCNWMQCFEGEIDTLHFNYLHCGSVDLENIPAGHAMEHTVGTSPTFSVQETELGTSYAAYTQIDDGQTYWRFAHFAFPFWSYIPQADIRYNLLARAWVPLDDEHAMLCFIGWKSGRPGLGAPMKDGKPLAGGNLFKVDYQPNTTDWFGRWRPVADYSNDWLQDRGAQRDNQIFSGIDGIHQQDQAVTESMGTILDRSLEHMVPSDLMVARTRRRMLQAARAFRDTGALPPGVDNPQAYYEHRGGYCITPTSQDWAKVYAEQQQTLFHPAPATARAGAIQP
jgi:phthalate 4,5-dioxygenase oxygenase subunit